MVATNDSKGLLTGYYRYTDIWFEWPQAIKDEANGNPLKASLAHDSLCSPDHPLHKDGAKGVTLYMGAFPNGESRLLFSSAQVDYLRYWLYAMKLTPTMVPLPYSNCLLTADMLTSVSPVVYATGGDLRSAVKKIQKNNKRVGKSSQLTTRREGFERGRTYFAEKKGVFCAMDFEAWDREHSMIIEFGWSSIWWENGVQKHQDGHLVVKEYENYHQTFVAEHRKDFKFGATQVFPKAAFKKRIQDLFTELRGHGAVYLIFHGGSQDIKYLQSSMVDIPLTGMAYNLPPNIPGKGIFLIDTVALFAALEGEAGANPRKLEQVAKHLQIPTEFLHNAGNDAHFTLQAAVAMLSGAPVDIQREQRWPNQTGPTTRDGLKVKFTPYQEDSDYFSEDEQASLPRGYGPDGHLLEN